MTADGGTDLNANAAIPYEESGIGVRRNSKR